MHNMHTILLKLIQDISTIIPKENGSTGLLLDVGLNADCKPEQLNQFAVMGSVFAKTILGIESNSKV